jgi:hypothetical protein
MAAHPDTSVSSGRLPSDWIEQHDKLPVSERAFIYHERNQQDWWEQNKRIRKLLLEVETVIKALIRAGEAPSVRMLSWSQLARRIGCDRATLQHVRRYHWVNEQRNQLLSLLHGAKEQKNVANDKAEKRLSEVERLKMSLQNQRDQTAVWYAKCMGLEEQITLLERLLAKREEKIEELVARNHQF